MPILMAMARHKCDGADGFTNGAPVDQLSAGLQGCTQKCIRRTPDPKPFGGGQLEYFPRLRAVNGQRLLVVNVLPGV